tara:strand:- start:797 stop:952 length:156 start_codon:yes stop_codon:yes gene_type:complete
MILNTIKKATSKFLGAAIIAMAATAMISFSHDTAATILSTYQLKKQSNWCD